MSPKRFISSSMSKALGRAPAGGRVDDRMSSHSDLAEVARFDRAVSRNRPSEKRITLALCTRVILLRPCARAYSNANRTMRCVPLTLMGLTVMPASSRTWVPLSACNSWIRARASGVPSSYSIPA